MLDDLGVFEVVYIDKVHSYSIISWRAVPIQDHIIFASELVE